MTQREQAAWSEALAALEDDQDWQAFQRITATYPDMCFCRQCGEFAKAEGI